jgi:DNA-binding NtrC family response regulator
MGPTVLIVEDEATLARNLAAYLERLNYDVHVAASAEDGLQQFNDLHPELVLLDHCLPGISGLEALQRMRAIEPRTHVVLMTGSGDVELAVKALKPVRATTSASRSHSASSSC